MVRLTQIPIVMPLSEILSKIEALQKNALPAGPVRLPDCASSHCRQAGPAAARPSDPPAENAAKKDAPSVQREAPVDPPAAASPAAGSIDLEEISGYWIKVVNYIKPKKISIASYMQEGFPTGIESNVLTIGFPKECQFHKEVLESPENKRIIEEALAAVTGLGLKVVLTVIEPAGGQSRPKAGGNADGANEGGSSETADNDESDPIVKAALDIFSGRIAGNSNEKGPQR